jgi:AcrR family transcriptional regulator
MVKSVRSDWRDARRRSARDAIIDAARVLVEREGLVGWSLRDLAETAGITTPTVYAYFDSKSAIYDAMFGQAATEFAARMTEPVDVDDAREKAAVYLRRFFEFCTTDPPRYQLLFQRVIPRFEPSPEAYAPAERVLAEAAERLAEIGVVEARHLDLWTALVTGLVDQQVSNDPGGSRWFQLIDEAVDMYLSHCLPPRSATKQRSRSTATSGGQS